MISVLNHQQQLSGNKIFLVIVLTLFFGACSPKIAPVVKKTLPPEVSKMPSKPVEEPKKESKPVLTERPEMVISLLLPFDLNEINYQTATSKELDKAKIAIDFYQGFKMGLDSIAKAGNTNFKLQVYDAQDKPTQIGELVAKEGIKNSDLFVGPVFPSGIKAFSYYSKALKKPMISPLAASDPDIFNNPYLITINNSIDQHAYKAVSFIKNQLKPKKVILIRSGQTDEYKYAIPFKKGIDSLAKGLGFSEIGIKAVGYENVYKSLNSIGLNVIVLPATDRVFLLTLFKELEKLSRTYQIAVVGHPDWIKAQFFDFNTLEKLNTYITSAFNIDYKSTRSLNFVKNYRSSFSLEPSEYAFKGFDIGFYFGKLMNEKGKDFLSELTKKSFDGIYNDFNFIKNPKIGYYNASLMMLKYQDNTLKKVN